jgi:hypothetical protein
MGQPLASFQISTSFQNLLDNGIPFHPEDRRLSARPGYRVVCREIPGALGQPLARSNTGATTLIAQKGHDVKLRHEPAAARPFRETCPASPRLAAAGESGVSPALRLEAPGLH